FNFFLSIPIPGFIPSDRFVWNGPVRSSFTDERSEEFRRSVKEKARRPTEATGSPNTNTGDE
ncbi:MAG: hypothetical protein ACLTXP_14185, partial [Odoribacter splanchnicus]